MVDERDERYEGEESEYHFSDEQDSYDELEEPKAAQPVVSEKESLASKLSAMSNRRRIIVASVVFIVLIGVVYKILSPSSSKIPIENELPPVTAATTTKPVVPQTPPVATPTPPTTATATLPVPPPTSAPVPVATVVVQPPAVEPPPAAVQPPPPIIVQSATPPTGNIPPQVVTATAPPPVKDVTERVTAVEQQNTAIVNLLQNEYGQKMSEYEMQNTLMRSKLDELNKRLNRIESTLNQATQLLEQGQASGSKPGLLEPQAVVPTKAIEPKITYTVQAIIPGRAWLKSESGDTVTVAEGDLLKNYGRIAKIDPYDGVVEIDTGNKTITLAYGMNVE